MLLQKVPVNYLKLTKYCVTEFLTKKVRVIVFISIQSWIPTRWEHFVGNRYAVMVLRNLVKTLRPQLDTGGDVASGVVKILLVGPSRSGKTALVRYFARCLLCKDFDEATWNACSYTCSSCQSKVFMHEDYGILRAEESHVGFFEIDGCHAQTAAALTSKLDEINSFPWREDLFVVFLDEAHRLASKKLDEMLLTEIVKRDYLWIAATAHPEMLEDMFVNRFSVVHTELPTRSELIRWLQDRCQEWGIKVEQDALELLAMRCNCRVGLALNVLAIAQSLPEGLTKELVECQTF